VARLILIFLAWIGPAYAVPDDPVPPPNCHRLPAIQAAADGEVLMTSGAASRLHRIFDAKLVVLSLIYTHCADAKGCPWATSILAMLRQRIQQEPELVGQVRFLSLSFDPANDTPEVMRRYGEPFGASDDWLFLTTRSETALAPILESYRQAITRQANAAGKPGEVAAHILRVFLIDRDKQIRNIYSSGFLDPELLLSDLRSLAREAAACAEAAGSTPHKPRDAGALIDFAQHPPLGLPAVPVPANNPLTPEKIALGQKLFFDRRLSRNNTLSCAMCHVPEQGFTSNEMATAVGFEGASVRRNAQTLFNVAYPKTLFHDGRENSLETQVWSPLLAANEMAAPSVGWIIHKIIWLRDYTGLFEQAFGKPAGMETVGQALASYERTLNAADSPFDRWYFRKQADALSAEAQQGFAIFTGKGACSACHTLEKDHALFTDQQFHGTGIGWRRSTEARGATSKVELAPGVSVEMDNAEIAAVSAPPAPDLGRYEVTQDPADRWKYRTPSLRNIALTAPYMHDGSLRSLEDVIAFYDAGGFPGPYTDPLIKPLGLSLDEKRQLLAFLKTLTGANTGELLDAARAAPVGDPAHEGKQQP
jgi:cytochrome c peroxidase